MRVIRNKLATGSLTDDKSFIHPLVNLLLNMSAGLKSEELKPAEVAMLVKEYGKDWKLKLGYQTNLEYLEFKYEEKTTPLS